MSGTLNAVVALYKSFQLATSLSTFSLSTPLSGASKATAVLEGVVTGSDKVVGDVGFLAKVVSDSVELLFKGAPVSERSSAAVVVSIGGKVVCTTSLRRLELCTFSTSSFLLCTFSTSSSCCAHSPPALSCCAHSPPALSW